MLKVTKFGGSSLASAEQMAKVGEIIRSDPDRKFIIPSAPGKRYSDDTKVTDMLYRCYDKASEGKDISNDIRQIASRYQEIIDGLGLNLSLEEEFDVIEDFFRRRAGRDYAASRGEYLNGIVLANYLGCKFIDAREVILFDAHGNFDAELTNDVCRERLRNVGQAVIPGFYGAMPDGSI
jgi:aspartate kinase